METNSEEEARHASSGEKIPDRALGSCEVEGLFNLAFRVNSAHSRIGLRRARDRIVVPQEAGRDPKRETQNCGYNFEYCNGPPWPLWVCSIHGYSIHY